MYSMQENISTLSFPHTFQGSVSSLLV